MDLEHLEQITLPSGYYRTSLKFSLFKANIRQEFICTAREAMIQKVLLTRVIEFSAYGWSWY